MERKQTEFLVHSPEILNILWQVIPFFVVSTNEIFLPQEKKRNSQETNAHQLLLCCHFKDSCKYWQRKRYICQEGGGGWGVKSDIWAQFRAYTSLHTRTLATLRKIKLLHLEFANNSRKPGNVLIYSRVWVTSTQLQRAIPASSELMSNCCFWASLDFFPPLTLP